MMMKLVATSSSISVLLGSLGAYAGASSSFPQPRETRFVAQAPQASLRQAQEPLPTAAPHLADPIHGLAGRQARVTNCGYVDGNISNPMSCADGYICSTSERNVGCCPSGSACDVVTACLDFEAYLRGLCDRAGRLTYCCSDIKTKFCTVLTYIDLPYQSIVGCATSPLAAPLYADPIVTSSTTSTSSTTTSTTTTHPPPPPEAPGSGASIGVIVGAVVGGITALALLAGLLSFWLMRRREKKNKIKPNPGTGAVVIGTGSSTRHTPLSTPPLPVAQQHDSYYSAGAFSPRGSIAKPEPYSTSSMYGPGPSSGEVPPTPGTAAAVPPYNRYSPYGERSPTTSSPGGPSSAGLSSHAASPPVEMSADQVPGRVVHEIGKGK
ncbi:hypothetical protein N656DRAFT_779270 [Canariomyces notabilis]|uniref:Mid2 domain-containing protein n=1 Tax=Canariomyces notabilis TaxID=2074819 RepID=A0AAN6TDH7_9PEZI|nr:hypothetical protein N656DRAFT_779270 [Canariomyces arenarius]